MNQTELQEYAQGIALQMQTDIKYGRISSVGDMLTFLSKDIPDKLKHIHGAEDKKGIKCLDHGYIRLVDYMGSDLSVVRAARVSYDAACRAGKDKGSDYKLINYLWKNKHTSPFEACSVTFEVKAPIFVFRQWHRHRTWSYNEISARYKELPDEFYIPDADKIGVQSSDNKQMRVLDSSASDPELVHELIANQNANALNTYRDLLEKGVPRELARTVLPLSTYSHMFCAANLLNIFKFLSLRTHEHAQHEIRVYAEAMIDLIRPMFPVCVEAWEKGNE